MIRYLLVIVLFTLPVFAQPTEEQDTLITPSKVTRDVVDLSGEWDISYDDGDSWEKQYVPFTSYEGSTIVFKKNISLSKKNIANRSFHLNVQGISDNGEFYLNNQFLGSNFGGMTEFWVNLPNNSLKEGSNELKIVVNPSEGYAAQIQRLPLHSKRAATGIIRKVLLVSTAGAWVNSINSSYKFSEGGSSVAVNIQGTFTTGQLKQTKGAIVVKSHLVGNGTRQSLGSQTVNVDNNRSYDFDFKAVVNNPALWSPDSPNEYNIVTQIQKNGVTIDEYSTVFGFKKVEIISSDKGNKFILNGHPFELKSVNYIDDYKGYGQSIPLSQYEKDIKEIKKLGANAIRVKFGLPHSELIKLTSKYGLFVLYEFPSYNTPVSILNSDEVIVRMQNIADRILNAVDNFPNIFSYGLYSYSDEDANQQKEYSSNMISKLNQHTNNLIHKTIYTNTDYPNINDVDFLIVSFNNKSYNFNTQLKRLEDLQRNIGAVPLICELGTAVEEDNKNGYADKLSLEFQAYYLLNSYSILSTANIAGFTFDTYNDYLLQQPVMINNGVDKFVFTSGLVDRDRNERSSFKAVKSIFNKEKEPLLTAGSDDKADKTVVFLVTGIVFGLIFLIMINRFKRFREYFFRSILRPYNFYADIRDQRLISTVQTSVLAILISVSVASFISATFYYLRFSSTLEYFLNMGIPISIIKENLFSLVWTPSILILIMSLIIMLYILFIALFLKITAFALSVRLFYKDAFTLATWSLIPTILLLIVASFMIKIFGEMDNGYLLIFAILGFVKIWSLLRLLKSSAVVLDKPRGKVYLIEIVLGLIILGIPLFLMQWSRSVIDYLIYVLTVMV